MTNVTIHESATKSLRLQSVSFLADWSGLKRLPLHWRLGFPSWWRFLVRLSGAVSSSRPDDPRAPRAVAVEDDRRSPPARVARSVLDGGEHGAQPEPSGRTLRTADA